MVTIKHATATPYKIMYLGLIATMAIIVVMGAFVLLDDPRFKAAAFITNFKRAYYTTTFMSANALGAYGATQIESNTEVPQYSVPILVYHGITDEPDGSEINLTEEQFKEQMFALKRAGYTTITLKELYAFARDGKALPPRPVMITFDDGRTDSFYNADPILGAVDFNAVMFVITEYIDHTRQGGYYLSSDEVKLMADTGRWEVGSHSADGHDQWRINEHGDVGNFFSNHIWLADEHRVETEEEFKKRISNDFSESKKYLEGLLSTEITAFAFPFGDLGQNQLDAREKSQDIMSAATAFYNMLFYQQRPGEYFTQFSPLTRTNEKAFFIRRINMPNTWGTEEFLDILHDGEEKRLPYTDTFANDDGWIRVWGDHVIENKTLTLQAEQDSTGASTILDGSQRWSNYQVSLEARSPNQTGVFIWMRFNNDNTHAGCNFGTDFVHVEQTLNGEKRVLKGVERLNNIPEGWFALQARVEGRTLICSINGMEIVRTEFLEPSLTHGGIGFKIWDTDLGKSSVIIRQLKVEEIKSEE